MRVLHVVPSLDPATGGPARSVPALCRALQSAGVKVTLYTFRRPGSAVTTSPEGEFFPIHWFSPWPGTLEFPTLTFYRQLRQDLRRFDLVHLHSFWNPVISVAAFACRQIGVPYCLSPRGMLQNVAVRRKRWLKIAWYLAWERRTLGGARALHFFTDAEAQDSRRFLDGGASSFVVPSGIDLSLASGIQQGRFRKAHASLQGKRLALFLGRLHWSKGLDLQARALARLIEAFPDLIWVLVGPDGGEWAGLSRQIRDMRLQDHVLWTGPLSRKECLEALADADVFLLTSRHEAHSMAMNEALAVGVPLVITETVQFDEIRDWGAGRVVPWDPEHLSAAIASVLTHPEQAEKMRQAGRRLATERLTWPNVADAMARAYREYALRGSGTGTRPMSAFVQSGEN